MKEMNTNDPIAAQKTMNFLSWDVDGWNSFSQWASVGLVALTFAAGLVALLTGKTLNNRQAERILHLENDVATARDSLAKSEIKLKELQTPRSFILNPFKFIQALKGHEKTDVIVSYTPGLYEVDDLAKSLVSLLREAGWPATLRATSNSRTDDILAQGYGIRTVTGMDSYTSAESGKYVETLKRALEQGGLPTHGWAVDMNMPAMAVGIHVGPRP